MLVIDTKVEGPDGTYSYGPRVMGCGGSQVFAPDRDHPAEFWAVYRETETGSVWVSDEANEHRARGIARIAAGLPL